MTALDKKSEIIQKIIFHANTIPKILSGYQYFYNEELIQILEDYLQLKNIILNNYGRLNQVERKIYIKFWSLGTIRPSESFKNEYFNILNLIINGSHSANLNDILIKLKPHARNSYVFSHTTKLLHSSNEKNPIIDSKILNFFQLNSYLTIRKSERLNNYINIYSAFTEAYKEIEENNILKKEIDLITNTFPSFSKLSFSKKIDTIITDIIKNVE